MNMDKDLMEAIDLLKSKGFDVRSPLEVSRQLAQSAGPLSRSMGPTIEAPATGEAEMQAALASHIPGGDLSMASHAGLANMVGQLSHRVVLLEERLSRLASVLLDDRAAGQERPEHVEAEPTPVTEPTAEGLDAPADYQPVERGADGLPKEV